MALDTKALMSAKMMRPSSKIPPTTPSTIGRMGASFGQLTVIKNVITQISSAKIHLFATDLLFP